MATERRLKSPWKSPRKADGLSMQRNTPHGPLAPLPISSNAMRTPIKEGEADGDVPMVGRPGGRKSCH